MKLSRALQLADYYGGDMCFEDERDEMSAAMWALALQLRKLGERYNADNDATYVREVPS